MSILGKLIKLYLCIRIFRSLEQFNSNLKKASSRND